METNRTIHFEDLDQDKAMNIIGINDNNIKILSSCFNTNITFRNNDFIINNGWNVEYFELQKLKSKLINKYGTIKDIERINIKDGIQALWKKVYHITNYTKENN